MRYYQHLEFPEKFDFEEFVKFDLTNTSSSRKLIKDKPIDSRFVQFMNDHKILIDHYASFYTAPKSVLKVHLDYDGKKSFAKMNFVYAAPGSKMIWYRYKKSEYPPQAQRAYIDGLQYTHLDHRDCIRVDAAEIRQPTLVETGEPHSVFNPTDTGRWALTILMRDLNSKKVMVFEEARDLLSKYWID